MNKMPALAVAVLLLCGCNVDRGKKVDAQLLDFETSDRAEMFFKNMRQSNYVTEEDKNAGVYMYTHLDLVGDTSAAFVPTIVFNWRHDRAYIMLNWAEDFAHLTEVTVTATSDSLPEAQIKFYQGNMRDHVDFSAGLYNAISDNRELRIQHNGSERPLFVSQQQQEAFRVTFYDYLRLTGWF